MKLTEDLKNKIDKMDYLSMLNQWRFCSIGDTIFQNESGLYFAEKMRKLRQEPGGEEQHVRASKHIGWDQ